jgi:Spy/CpxP family protein refolding chaperone
MSARGRFPLSAALALLAVVLLLPTGASTQGGDHGRKWWQDASFRQQLGLSDEQSTRIDEIYQSTVPRLREQYDASHAEEKQLQKLIDANEPEAVVSAQIDKMESAYCQARKTRLLMLYEMRMVLSPDQRERFHKVHDDWERAHRKGGGHGHDEG